MLNKQNYVRFLDENKIVKRLSQPLRLSGGKYVKDYYVDFRVMMDFANKDLIFLKYYLNDMFSYDIRVANLPYVGLGFAGVLATIMNFEDNKSHAILRDTPKLHGQFSDIFWLGKIPESIIVLEDVVTTGQSVEKFINRIQDTGVKVQQVISLFDRSGKGFTSLCGIYYQTLITMEEYNELTRI